MISITNLFFKKLQSKQQCDIINNRYSELVNILQIYYPDIYYYFNYDYNELSTSEIHQYLVQLLFPFINNFNDMNTIIDLNEIFTTKNNHSTNLNIKYEYTTYQYDHYKKNSTNSFSDDSIMNYNENDEYNFNITDFNNNFMLLIKSIQTSANRLYVNWSSVFPMYTMKDNDDNLLSDLDIEIIGSALYQNTIDDILTNDNYIFNYNDFDIFHNQMTKYINSVNNKKYKVAGLPLITIYNICSHNKNHRIIKMYFTNYKFKHEYWESLNITEKQKFLNNLKQIIKRNKTKLIIGYINKNKHKIKDNDDNINNIKNDIILNIFKILHNSGTFNTIKFNKNNIINHTKHIELSLTNQQSKISTSEFFASLSSADEIPINVFLLNPLIQYDITDAKLYDNSYYYLKINILNDNNKNDNNTNNLKYPTFKEVDIMLEQTKQLDIDNFSSGITSTLLSDLKKKKLNQINRSTEEIEQYKFNYNNNYLFRNNNSSWSTRLAMHWIFQINFYNKFLHNRIIFATGSTGTGKSTQVPKLALYALTAFEYNKNAYILCSQPRKRPTSDNSIFISKQMGVNIPLYPPVNWNGPIQYQNGDDDIHTNKKKIKDRPIIKMVTDKILLDSLVDLPFCCKTINKHNNKIFDHIDTVIVDEAHEHNINMDLILTIMRYYCLINRRIHLIIISATMDDDEPTYRRYYAPIRDIYKYPINNSMLLLSAISKLDRRFDISTISGGNFPITDIFIDLSYKQIKNEEYKNEQIYKILNTELTKDFTEDILIFKSGISDITKLINYLKPLLPNNILLIPYLSSLNQSIKEFIEQIHRKHKQDIKIDHNIDIATLEDPNEFLKGSGQYKHFILVATNIAEASITIDTLTHVIDDGLQKINVYSKEHNTTVLLKDYIALSNSLQRRGRVGRRKPGIAYRLYSEHALDNIKQQYKICTMNIMSYILEMLISENEINKTTGKINLLCDITDSNNLFVIDDYTNKNGITFKQPKLNINLNDIHNEYSNIKNMYTDDLLQLAYIYENGIDSGSSIGIDVDTNVNIAYNKQNNKLIINDLYYDNIKYQLTQNGHYTIDILNDNDNTFYIISPFENELTRDFFGRNGNHDNSKVNRFTFNNLLIWNYSYSYMVKNITTSNYKNTIFKTKLYDQIFDIKRELNLYDDIDNFYIACLLISIKLNCFNLMVKIISFVKHYDKIKNIYNNCSTLTELFRIYHKLNNNIKNSINELIYNYKIIFERVLTKHSINEFYIPIAEHQFNSNKQKVNYILTRCLKNNIVRKVLNQNKFISLYELNDITNNFKVLEYSKNHDNMTFFEGYYIYFKEHILVNPNTGNETNQISLLHKINYNDIKSLHLRYLHGININKQLTHEQDIFDTLNDITRLVQ